MKNYNKILITGGLGYIGSHTAICLIENELDVVIIDNLSNSEIENLYRIEEITGKSVKFYNEDLRNFNSINNIFNLEKIDCVIHFAAKIWVEESMYEPLEYYDNNINSLITLLKVMKNNDVNNLIFSSSCTVYGDPDRIPVIETTAIKKAKSIYGDTKIMSEQILENISKLTQLKTISLRYFNPVGAHSSGKIGELNSSMNSHIFPKLSGMKNSRNYNFEVYGNDYNTIDGTCVRDYIHIEDLAEAHLKSIEYINKSNIKFDVFNIGTGKGYTVLEIIKAFENEYNKKIEYRFSKRRIGDIESIFTDNNKAQNELDWTPKYNLEEMVKSTLNWTNRNDKFLC